MTDPRLKRWLELVRQGRWDTTQVNPLWVPKREIIKRGLWRPVWVGGILMLGAPIVASATYEIEGKEWPHPHRFDRAYLLKPINSDEDRINYLDLVFLSTVSFLTGAGQIPADCSTSRVDLIGAGSKGQNGTTNGGSANGEAGGFGGGGGAWAYKATVTGITTGTSYTIPSQNSGTDADFKSGTVVADSAAANSQNGGLASNSTGDAKADGGNGGNGGATSSSGVGSGGGGGGGAGGKGTSDAGAAGNNGQDGVAGDGGGNGGNGGRGDGSNGGAGAGGAGQNVAGSNGSDGAEYTQTSPSSTLSLIHI